MSDNQFPTPGYPTVPPAPGAITPQGPAPVARKKGRWFTSRPAVGVAALLVGAGIGTSGSTGSTAAKTAQAPAVTVTAAAPTVTVTAPGATVQAAAPTSTVTVTQTAEAPAPAAAFSDGVHLVGSDIQPGTYKAANSDGDCYWARLKNTDGNFAAIIANGNPSGQAVVTIAKSDGAFESSRCGDWVKVK